MICSTRILLNLKYNSASLQHHGSVNTVRLHKARREEKVSSDLSIQAECKICQLDMHLLRSIASQQCMLSKAFPAEVLEEIAA